MRRRDFAPWRGVDLVGVVLWNAAAVTLLVVSALTAGASDSVPSQVPWANLSVVALVGTGAGNAVWLLAGRGAVRRRRLALAEQIAELDIPGMESAR
jgi:hypothetical protein